jgi:hypothetical protein
MCATLKQLEQIYRGGGGIKTRMLFGNRIFNQINRLFYIQFGSDIGPVVLNGSNTDK